MASASVAAASTWVSPYTGVWATLRSSRTPSRLAVALKRDVREAHPKLHLEPDCGALRFLPPLTQEEAEALAAPGRGSVGMVAEDFTDEELVDPGQDHRLCRRCALETVASHLIASGSGRGCLVTFSAQPLVPVSRGEVWQASQTGQERVARIAARTGLATVDTVAGVVAYGQVPEQAKAVLGMHLRVFELPAVPAGAADEESMELFWGLVSNRPPARRPVPTPGLRGEADEVDPWRLTQAVLGRC